MMIEITLAPEVAEVTKVEEKEVTPEAVEVEQKEIAAEVVEIEQKEVAEVEERKNLLEIASEIAEAAEIEQEKVAKDITETTQQLSRVKKKQELKKEQERLARDRKNRRLLGPQKILLGFGMNALVYIYKKPKDNVHSKKVASPMLYKHYKEHKFKYTIQENDYLQKEHEFKYTVQENDHLQKIARNFNISASDIKGWNKLKTNRLKKGQVLTLQIPLEAEGVSRLVGYVKTVDDNSLVLKAQETHKVMFVMKDSIDFDHIKDPVNRVARGENEGEIIFVMKSGSFENGIALSKLPFEGNSAKVVRIDGCNVTVEIPKDSEVKIPLSSPVQVNEGDKIRVTYAGKFHRVLCSYVIISRKDYDSEL